MIICWKELSFLRYLTFIVIFLGTGCRQEASDKKSLQKAIRLKEEPAVLDTAIVLAQADSLFQMAERYDESNQMDSALSFHKKSMAIREKLLTNDIRMVNSYFKVGRLYVIDNKFDIADKYLEKARKIADIIHAPLQILLGIYTNLTDCKREMKDFPTAISLAQRLLHLVVEQDPGNKNRIIDVYHLLAAIYLEEKQFDKAIENWRIAIQLTPQSDHKLLGVLFNNAAIAYQSTKNYKASLLYLNKSIEQDLIWAGSKSYVIANRYLQKAFALLALEQNDSAHYLLNQTLEIRVQNFGEKNINTFGAKYSLGEFFYKIGRYDSAVFYHHQSLISLIKSFNNPNLYANPKPSLIELNPDLIRGLVKKASAVMRLFENDSSKTELLDLALNTYFLADSVLAGYRKNILHDDPLMEQMEDMSIPYGEMLNITLKLYNIKKSNVYFEKAFNIMERSRAVVLQNALNRAATLSSTGISDSLIDKENKLIRLRAELLQQINRPDLLQPVLDSLNEELLMANNRTVDLQEELKKINSNYFTTKYETHLPTSTEVKKFLKATNSIFLEYMWSEQAIYTLMVSPDTIRIGTIAATEKYANAFKGFVTEFHSDPEGTVGRERYKNFCRNSSALFNYLLKDLLNGVAPDAHLIISVDGQLAAVPFEALIVNIPRRDEVNYHLPYLVLEHPLSYAYSAGVLLKQSNHKREGNKLLAFGYAGTGSTRQDRSGLSNLPGTEKEVLAIKDVMKNSVNQYKLKGEASEAIFKKQAHDFDIVHLAVHGEGDTLNALNSRLIFRSEQDTVEDGSLYAHELYDLNLDKLDLIVLSACESGVGKRQTGEGVMSIARGFAYAGCPSLMISLWKIDDRTSAKVMRGFYNHLSNGEPLDVALAKAKSDYIKEASEFNSHPFYWAAFLQVGDVRAIEKTKMNWKFWISGIVILLFFCVVAYRAKLKHPRFNRNS